MTNTASPALSLVMPCFNEIDCIESVIREWSTELDKLGEEYEILVVNDGSSDGSSRKLDQLRRELRSLRVIHQLNSGHGKAVRRGMEAARGKYVFRTEANGRYRPSDFPKLWELRRDFHLILGKRHFPSLSLYRRLVMGTLMRVTSALFPDSPADPNAPVRLFRKDVILPLLNSLPPEFECIDFCIALLAKHAYPQAVTEVSVEVVPATGRRAKLRRLDRDLDLLTEVVRLRLERSKPQYQILSGAAARA